jgi:hypothetical protein
LKRKIRRIKEIFIVSSFLFPILSEAPYKPLQLYKKKKNKNKKQNNNKNKFSPRVVLLQTAYLVIEMVTNERRRNKHGKI